MAHSLKDRGIVTPRVSLHLINAGADTILAKEVK
jgi:hypothetical protein